MEFQTENKLNFNFAQEKIDFENEKISRKTKLTSKKTKINFHLQRKKNQLQLAEEKS